MILITRIVETCNEGGGRRSEIWYHVIKFVRTVTFFNRTHSELGVCLHLLTLQLT
jgi:hypothetical protein